MVTPLKRPKKLAMYAYGNKTAGLPTGAGDASSQTTQLRQFGRGAAASRSVAKPMPAAMTTSGRPRMTPPGMSNGTGISTGAGAVQKLTGTANALTRGRGAKTGLTGKPPTLQGRPIVPRQARVDLEKVYSGIAKRARAKGFRPTRADIVATYKRSKAKRNQKLG